LRALPRVQCRALKSRAGNTSVLTSTGCLEYYRFGFVAADEDVAGDTSDPPVPFRAASKKFMTTPQSRAAFRRRFPWGLAGTGNRASLRPLLPQRDKPLRKWDRCRLRA